MTTTTKNIIVPLLAIVACLVFTGIIFAADKATTDKAAAAAPAKDKALKPYPLDKCIITGNKLGEMGEPVVTSYKDREIKFCCSGCKPKFDKDPEGYIKKIDAEAAKQKAATPPKEEKK